jgi:cytochrome c-type biogenesis protein CcmH
MTLFIFLSLCLLLAVLALFKLFFKVSVQQRGSESAEWDALVAKRDEIEQDVQLAESSKQILRQEWAVSSQQVLNRLAQNKTNPATQANIQAATVSIPFKPLALAALVIALLCYVGVGQWQADALQWPNTSENTLQTSAEPPPEEGAKHPGDMKSLDEHIAQLRAKLKENPDDLDRWVLLARSLSVQRDFQASAQAIREALRLSPGHPDLLADLADVVAMTNNSSLMGEPMQLIEQALVSAPNHPKALALAATAAMQQGNQTLALSYWQRLRATYPESSADVARIDEIVKQIQTQGLKRPSASETPAPPQSTAQLTGEVSLAPSMLQLIKTQDTSQAVLYVFAKMESGPPMPLAVFKSPIDALLKGQKIAFHLDDSMAMRPDLKLSSAKQVRLEARIAMTGNAIKQAGDYTAVLSGSAVGQQGLQLVIAEQIK